MELEEWGDRKVEFRVQKKSCFFVVVEIWDKLENVYRMIRLRSKREPEEKGGKSHRM